MDVSLANQQRNDLVRDIQDHISGFPRGIKGFPLDGFRGNQLSGAFVKFQFFKAGFVGFPDSSALLIGNANTARTCR